MGFFKENSLGQSEENELFPSTPLDKVVDFFFYHIVPVPHSLPNALLRRRNEVMEPYRKVLAGEITDPVEAEAIKTKLYSWGEQTREQLQQL